MQLARGARGSSRRRITFVALALAVSLALAVAVAFRIERTGSIDTSNLVWNLFLAWIPFLIGLAVYDGARRGAARPLVVAGTLLWLLFLPNAPYIVTDVIWLDDWRHSGAPIWYDLSLYLVAACTAGVLGFVSVYLVQRAASRLHGAAIGWAVAVASLALSGVGVYLGRVLRWNSWDLFTRPAPLLRDLAVGVGDPLAHPRALALTILCAGALVVGYALFYGLFRAQLRKLEGG